MGDDAIEQVSEVAQVLGEISRALPERDADALRRLLAHDLTARPPGEGREARLGLLIDLLADGTGEVPSVALYEEARLLRARAGERWPSHSTLIRSYRHWLAAVKAAMRLLAEGSPARVPRSFAHAGFHPPYQREEILTALRRCREALGEWPTQWEYVEWAALSRSAARIAGQAAPRIPVLKPIRRYFGTYANAVSAAAALPRID